MRKGQLVNSANSLVRSGENNRYGAYGMPFKTFSPLPVNKNTLSLASHFN